jgi:hypothetical protein
MQTMAKELLEQYTGMESLSINAWNLNSPGQSDSP